MKKAIWLIAALTIFINIQVIYSAATFKGKLLGVDSKAMPAADIIVYNLSDRRDVQFYRVNKDGSYNFTISSEGYYQIHFAGVGHQLYFFPIYISNDKELIELNVNLSPYKFDNILDNLTVIGSFNAFSFDEGGIPMNKQADGSFIAEVPNDKDTLYYQILGAVTEPELRSINGTMADDYQYDGGGDYRTLLYSTDKKVKLKFEPKKISKEFKLPVLKSSNLNVNNYIEAYNSIRDLSILTGAQINNMLENDNQSNILTVIESAFDKLKSLYNKYTDNRTRAYLLLEYCNLATGADFFGFDDLIDVNLIVETINRVQPNSVLWSQYSRLPAFIYEFVGEETAGTFINRLIAENPDTRLKRSVEFDISTLRLIINWDSKSYVDSTISVSEFPEDLLYDALSKSFNNKLDNAGKLFYAILQDKYPNSNAAKNARYEFDENRKIQKNKKVPDFKLASLDDPTQIITPQSFNGKFVLIDLWATWCGPCIGEMDFLEKAHNKFKDKNFEIFSISFDRTPDHVQRFRSGKWKLPWLNAFAEGAFSSEIGDIFEVTGIPRPILINPEGIIVALEGELRGNQLLMTLEKHIK